MLENNCMGNVRGDISESIVRQLHRQATKIEKFIQQQAKQRK
jgi:hypothetical protein